MVLQQTLEKINFLDGLVNGPETQAAYENVLKAMDNQVVSLSGPHPLCCLAVNLPTPFAAR